MTTFEVLNLFLQTLFEVDKRVLEGGIYTVNIECTVQYNILFVHNYFKYLFLKLNLALEMWN